MSATDLVHQFNATFKEYDEALLDQQFDKAMKISRAFRKDHNLHEIEFVHLYISWLTKIAGESK